MLYAISNGVETLVQHPSRTISIRIDAEKLRRLEDLAAITDRPRSWHIEQALEAYLDRQAWQLAHIDRGITSIEAGRVVPHQDVRDWLLSWSKDDEREPPG